MLDTTAIQKRIDAILDWCDYEQLEQLKDDAECLVVEVGLLQGHNRELAGSLKKCIHNLNESDLSLQSLRNKLAELYRDAVAALGSR